MLQSNPGSSSVELDLALPNWLSQSNILHSAKLCNWLGWEQPQYIITYMSSQSETLDYTIITYLLHTQHRLLHTHECTCITPYPNVWWHMLSGTCIIWGHTTVRLLAASCTWTVYNYPYWYSATATSHHGDQANSSEKETPLCKPLLLTVIETSTKLAWSIQYYTHRAMSAEK